MQVIKLRSARSLKLGCTAAVYHQDGKLVAAGGEDGSLHLIQLDKLYAKHEVVREAHTVRWFAGRCYLHPVPSRLLPNDIMTRVIGWDWKKKRCVGQWSRFLKLIGSLIGVCLQQSYTCSGRRKSSQVKAGTFLRRVYSSVHNILGLI